jgi:N-acetylglucosamine-6-sulfatase
MNKYFRIASILALFSLLTGCLQKQTNPPSLLKTATIPDTRPNILFILTDDLDKATIAYMPKLKALLQTQGTELSKFVINVPLCCPSRSSILLGQYSQNTQILTNAKVNGGYQTFHALGYEDKNIATDLQNSGYQTVLIGKYLNGYPKTVETTYVPPGWTEWYSPAVGNPYREYGYSLNENGKLVKYGEEPKDYLEDVLANKAVDFIQRNSTTGRPFFMFLSTYAPHAPANPAPRHSNLFTDIVIPRSPSFNEADVSDKPESVKIHALRSVEYIAIIDALFLKRIQSIQSVDEMLERVVSTLQTIGQLNNTYIIFTSDNGFHMGEHRMMPGKQLPYEEDIIVPFFVRGPGIPNGVIQTELIGNIDLAPTFAEIADISLSDQSVSPAYDGRSFLSIIQGKPVPNDWRKAYLVQRWRALATDDEGVNNNNNLNLLGFVGYGVLEPPDLSEYMDVFGKITDTLPFSGIRTQDYLYVEYDIGDKELYDLRVDPYEMNNLVASADPIFLQQMSNWLAQVKICAGNNCNQAEQLPDNFGKP